MQAVSCRKNKSKSKEHPRSSRPRKWPPYHNHTATVSGIADAGVPEARIQTGLRHATAAMTRRYTEQRDKGEAARALGDVMVRTA